MTQRFNQVFHKIRMNVTLCSDSQLNVLLLLFNVYVFFFTVERIKRENVSLALDQGQESILTLKITT